VRYPFHPCDVVGWKGDVAPMRLNVADIRPVTSPRYHLPPSAHTTWVADGFVVCTFAPRPMEEDPDALRLPFFHRNVDYDEVIFYHRGEFFSRAGIREGMMTFHPFGLHHGPQPGARARDAAAATAANGGARRMANEYAVMVDTRRPLTPGPEAARIEVEGYVRSWTPDSDPATP
jgi:homogentisate 1,2-dioxygenase